MKPAVTVAIPFHDEERYLEAAIRSVLAQTFTDFELLLVDDGSRDGSLAIARRFTADPRVRVLSDGRRRHLPARLNQIVGSASADLVARMDGDDVMHPRRLEKQVALLTADPSIDGVGTWAALVDDDERIFGVMESSTTPPVTGRSLLERGLVSHATLTARRAWLRAHPYDETLTRAEDRDLWCRTGLSSRVVAIEDVLYVVRVSPRDARFLHDYLEGQRHHRVVVARYGRELVGTAPMLRLLVASAAKSAAMRIADRLSLAERLTRRRGRPPTDSEIRRVREAFAAARPPQDQAPAAISARSAPTPS